jgi:hypothetical protein
MNTLPAKLQGSSLFYKQLKTEKRTGLKTGHYGTAPTIISKSRDIERASNTTNHS